MGCNSQRTFANAIMFRFLVFIGVKISTGHASILFVKCLCVCVCVFGGGGGGGGILILM